MLRMTHATAQILQALDAGYRYGFDLADATRLRGGTIYPILRRLESEALITSEWEDVGAARDAGRPPRKYYRLLPAATTYLNEANRRFPFQSAAKLPRPEVAR